MDRQETGNGVAATMTSISDRVGMGAAVLLGLSIPVSTGADSILTVAVLLFWILGLRYREKTTELARNPVVRCCILILAAYLAGALYSDAGAENILDSLGNARIFLLIPLLMTFFMMPGARLWGLRAFMGALVLILVLSYLLWFDLLPALSLIKGTPENPTVFKLHITHNLLMAFGAYLFAVLAFQNPAKGKRIIFSAMSFAAAFNVLFMAQGRTGYVILGGLTALFLTQVFRWKGLVIAAAVIALVGFGAFAHKENPLYERVDLMIQEIKDWDPERTQSESGVGERLDFYRTSITLFRDNPFFGVGTGGFEKAYADRVAGTELRPTSNPHNEYLIVAVQLGLFGLVCYALLFMTQWRYASRMNEGTHRMLARGLVVTILSASLVSSTLIDHTEGLFFAWMTALFFAGATSRFGWKARYEDFRRHYNQE